MILLDTCSLIWYTLGPEDALSSKACKALRETPEILVSVISLWELGIKIQKKSIELPMTLESYLTRLKQVDTIQIIPLDENIVVKAFNLNWKHRDPVDRFIVATAAHFGVSVVTSDREIGAFYKKTVW
ncbi:MAG: type II toxin-antitoxin system VapC family toxin [Fibrobacterota bacterium]